MPISSLIVRTEEKMTENVASELRQLPGAEICDIHESNIVLLTETTQQTHDKDIWNTIEKIPGVLQCDLIYHNFEDEEGFRHG